MVDSRMPTQVNFRSRDAAGAQLYQLDSLHFCAPMNLRSPGSRETAQVFQLAITDSATNPRMAMASHDEEARRCEMAMHHAHSYNRHKGRHA
jgi:hypothetical protein